MSKKLTEEEILDEMDNILDGIEVIEDDDIKMYIENKWEFLTCEQFYTILKTIKKDNKLIKKDLKYFIDNKHIELEEGQIIE